MHCEACLSIMTVSMSPLPMMTSLIVQVFFIRTSGYNGQLFPGVPGENYYIVVANDMMLHRAYLCFAMLISPSCIEHRCMSPEPEANGGHMGDWGLRSPIQQHLLRPPPCPHLGKPCTGAECPHHRGCAGSRYDSEGRNLSPRGICIDCAFAVIQSVQQLERLVQNPENLDTRTK